MKRIKFIARTLLILFVGLVVGFNLYSWNARSLTGNELPMPMGYGAALVLTGSMEPTIMADDLILVSAHESYDAGDIVVYQSGRILVVHRILRMEENAIITKGDANQAEDEPVAPEQIKGKVIAVIPFLGTVARILKTPVATVALLIAAVLMMERSFRKEKQKHADDLEQIKAEIRKLKEEQESAE